MSDILHRLQERVLSPMSALTPALGLRLCSDRDDAAFEITSLRNEKQIADETISRLTAERDSLKILLQEGALDKSTAERIAWKRRVESALATPAHSDADAGGQ